MIFFGFAANAEIIVAKGKHKHLGKNYTTEQSCKIAEAKAKRNAITKSLGQKVSTDVVSKCSELDGEYNCERNQLSIFELNGDIVEYEIISQRDDKELGSEIYFCEIDIKADVRPIKINQDPTFQFSVKLNKEIFENGQTMEININVSREMYMSIFNWLPNKKVIDGQVIKIFPSEKFNKIGTNNNNIDLINKKTTLKYKVNFPNDSKLKKVDQYLVFIASESKIPWLDDYTKIESLKKQLNKSKILMEKYFTSYIVYNNEF